MTEKLKPCPLCGRDYLNIRKKESCSETIYVVYCESCGSMADSYDTPKEAIEAWNMRTQKNTEEAQQ